MIPALYQFLTANCKSVTAWYQSGTDLAGKVPPFGIIEIRAEQASLNNRRGGWEYVRLWVHFTRGSWIPVVSAVDELRNIFNGMTLIRSTGGRFQLEALPATAGFFDDVLNTFARAIDFRVPAVRPGD